ncbi:MAG: molybdopterin dinucleotide binding domain-containing protein, partial [Raoultibacter sp.]
EALLEIDTEQFVYINPDDAIELGIADGDEVKVHNDRGYLVAHACIRPNNPRGVLSAVKGWMPDQVIEGHLSSLGTLVSNSFCANQPFNDCAVAIEKK